MERIIKKYEKVCKALESLEQAVDQHQKWIHQLKRNEIEALGIDYDGIIKNLRDSSIQRFEYSVDLLWKFLRLFLEQEKIDLEIISPANVIRAAGNAKVITETEVENFLEMIKKRNMTSHIYQEEIAEILSHDLQKYIPILNEIATKIDPLHLQKG